MYRYVRLPIKEVSGLIIDSSNARLRVFDRAGKPKTKQDVLNMLGDDSDQCHPVFRGGAAFVKTIAVGKLNFCLCLFNHVGYISI